MGALQSVIRGIGAGAEGTLAMDSLLSRRYHEGGPIRLSRLVTLLEQLPPTNHRRLQ